MFCRNCGKELSDQAVMCVSCGAPPGLPREGHNYCPNCGSKTDPAAQVCMNCGISLALSAVTEYAGFWRRLVAALIDGIILSIPTFFMGSTSVARVLGVIVYWLYGALMESSSRQATLGKMALGIIVTDMNGDRISFGRASGRHFAKFISYIILLIGFLMAGFTEKKQALHDMIAGCLVTKGSK